MLLKKIRERANKAVRDIEKRNRFIQMPIVDMLIYKESRYVDDRNLEDYCNCLPELKKALKDNIKVLDIGCGQGNALREIKDRYNCSVVGTTLGVSQKFDFLIKDAVAETLPFDNNTFDLVISVHGISWEPNQKKAIEEVIRVLKPGGTALIYLIRFSHSIALFVGGGFWDGIDKNEYASYEFQPDMVFEGAEVYVQELEFINEECEGHYKEWQLRIVKNY